MSDYTPTTDDVRMGWADLRAETIQEGLAAEAEFDRWLAQHDREVRAAALDDAAAKIESKRSLLGIASRALDIGQAWSAALLRDDAKRLRDGSAS